MTDNLVQLLRTPNGILDWELRHVCADRIEALEAALRGIINWQDVSAEGVGLTLALKKIQGMREIARHALEGEP